MEAWIRREAAEILPPSLHVAFAVRGKNPHVMATYTRRNHRVTFYLAWWSGHALLFISHHEELACIIRNALRHEMYHHYGFHWGEQPSGVWVQLWGMAIPIWMPWFVRWRWEPRRHRWVLGLDVAKLLGRWERLCHRWNASSCPPG